MAIAQETVAIGGAKTGDAMNAIVPTLLQTTKWVDLPHVNKRFSGIQWLLVQITLKSEYGEGERDDDGHFFLESADFVTPASGDSALEHSSHNQDRDDDVTALKSWKSFRLHGWCQGVKDRLQIMRDTSKEPRCDFLLSNARSASSLNAEWEAHALDQYIVASAVMMLRTFVKWNPRTPKDVQVWCQTLGNIFGGGRQSFREHLAEGHAAAASCQVDFKKKKSREGELREGVVFIPQSSFQPCAAPVP